MRARVARGEADAGAIPASLPPDKLAGEIARLERQSKEVAGSLALLKEMQGEEGVDRGNGDGEG